MPGLAFTPLAFTITRRFAFGSLSFLKGTSARFTEKSLQLREKKGT